MCPLTDLWLSYVDFKKGPQNQPKSVGGVRVNSGLFATMQIYFCWSQLVHRARSADDYESRKYS